MITNCSHLSNDGSLEEDFFLLPQVNICFERWRYYLPSLVDANGIGRFIMAIIGVGVLIVTGIPSLAQLICPIGDDTIMFSITFQYHKRLLAKKIRGYLIDILSSTLNYRANLMEKIFDRSDMSKREIDKMMSRKFNIQRESRLAIMASYRHQDILKDHGDLDDYIRDCLPIVRTEWWRKHLHHTFSLIGHIFPYALLVGQILSSLNVAMLKFRSQFVLTHIAQTIRSNGCAIWYDDSNLLGSYEAKRIIDLDSLSLGNSIVGGTMIGYAVTISLSCMFFVLCEMYVLVVELLNWTIELKTETEFTLEYARIKASNICKYPITNLEPKTKVVLSDIQRAFIQSYKPNYVRLLDSIEKKTFFSSASRLNRKMFMQRLALKQLTIQNDSSHDSLIELKEKLYIKFRLLCDFKDNYAMSMTCLIIYGGLSALVASILILIVCREMNNIFPMFYMICCLIWVLGIISMAAHFRTNVSEIYLEKSPRV